MKINMSINKLVVAFSALLISNTTLGQTQKEESQNSSSSGIELVGVLDPNNPALKISKEELVKRALTSQKERTYALTPEQIKEIQDLEIRRQKALMMRSKPKEQKGITRLSSLPTAETPVIKISPNRSTMVTVVDSTGQPWPIMSLDIGAEDFINGGKIDKYSYDNAFKLKPKLTFGFSNAAIILKDLPQMFNIDIEVSETHYHSTPIIQIDQPGPNAKTIGVPRRLLGFSNDPELKALLNGAPPERFEQVATNDEQVKGWIFEGALYVLTQHAPVSPQPVNVQHGANGYAAYKMQDLPAIFFRTQQGTEKLITFTAN